jgi:hypothetical protein
MHVPLFLSFVLLYLAIALPTRVGGQNQHGAVDSVDAMLGRSVICKLAAERRSGRSQDVLRSHGTRSELQK